MKLFKVFFCICSFTFCNVTYTFGQEKRIKIPVIFHILYSNETENVSTDSILAELKNLHDDFLMLNNTSDVITQFKNVIGNPNIYFYLADSIFPGNSEKGIIRINAKKNIRNLYKTSPVVNSQKYLNVYIGNIKFHGRYTDGFTPVPFDSLVHEDDAVHLRYKWIGGHYHLLTHEVGHWLGLWHVFEDGCKDGDLVSDTPPQKQATDGACDLCPPTVKDQTCTTLPSNYNNFMDYSGCRQMFTKEQCGKMRNTIKDFRPLLWRNSN